MTKEPGKNFLARINPIRVRNDQALDHRVLEFQADSVELEKQPVPTGVRLTYYFLLGLVVAAVVWSPRPQIVSLLFLAVCSLLLDD